jgi:hypothetical protein
MCECGHRRREHERSENVDHPCLICDCPDFIRVPHIGLPYDPEKTTGAP